MNHQYGELPWGRALSGDPTHRKVRTVFGPKDELAGPDDLFDVYPAAFTELAQTQLLGVPQVVDVLGTTLFQAITSTLYRQ